MSITLPIPAPVTATQVLIRPYMIQVNSPYKQDGNVTSFGEGVPLDDAGDQVAQPNRNSTPIVRSQEQIAAEPDVEYTRPDNTTGTMKPSDLFFALAALYDRWVVEEQEKVKNPPPPPVPVPGGLNTVPTWP